MKLLHLSDLHLGKRVCECSMLEEQRAILAQILDILDAEAPDAVLLAGDIYDKTVPPAEAVSLFDDFLVRLAARAVPVFILSGNHDSPERIAFGARLMQGSGVHLSPVYDGDVRPTVLHDEHGAVEIFMLPFVKPAQVRRYFPDEAIETYTDAVRVAVQHMPTDSANRKVLLAHQFVTGAARADSEELSVGGLDNVDAEVFAPFDYVALGHLHAPQNVGSPRLRYCGTPLKYSFSEARQQKSVTLAQLDAPGELRVTTVPLTPQRDLAELRGSYLELTARSFYSGIDTDAYLHITLTDEDDIPEAIAKLRTIYPNILQLSYDNVRTRARAQVGSPAAPEQLSPLELFAELYEKQNNQPLSDAQTALLAPLMQHIWEDTL